MPASAPSPDPGYLGVPALTGTLTGSTAAMSTMAPAGGEWISSWRSPAFTGELTHLVDATAPTGLVADLARPGTPTTWQDPQDLGLPTPPGPSTGAAATPAASPGPVATVMRSVRRAFGRQPHAHDRSLPPTPTAPTASPTPPSHDRSLPLAPASPTPPSHDRSLPLAPAPPAETAPSPLPPVQRVSLPTATTTSAAARPVEASSPPVQRRALHSVPGTAPATPTVDPAPAPVEVPTLDGLSTQLGADLLGTPDAAGSVTAAQGAGSSPMALPVAQRSSTASATPSAAGPAGPTPSAVGPVRRRAGLGAPLSGPPANAAIQPNNPGTPAGPVGAVVPASLPTTGGSASSSDSAGTSSSPAPTSSPTTSSSTTSAPTTSGPMAAGGAAAGGAAAGGAAAGGAAAGGAAAGGAAASGSPAAGSPGAGGSTSVTVSRSAKSTTSPAGTGPVGSTASASTDLPVVSRRVAGNRQSEPSETAAAEPILTGGFTDPGWNTPIAVTVPLIGERPLESGVDEMAPAAATVQRAPAQPVSYLTHDFDDGPGAGSSSPTAATAPGGTANPRSTASSRTRSGGPGSGGTGSGPAMSVPAAAAMPAAARASAGSGFDTGASIGSNAAPRRTPSVPVQRRVDGTTATHAAPSIGARPDGNLPVARLSTGPTPTLGTTPSILGPGSPGESGSTSVPLNDAGPAVPLNYANNPRPSNTSSSGLIEATVVEHAGMAAHEHGSHSGGTSTPTLQRSTAPAADAPASTSTTAPNAPNAQAGAGNPATMSSADVDSLARRLYDPIARRLRAELWVDRDRTGTLMDRTW